MKYETHSLISAVWLADGKVSTGMINVLLYPSWTVTRPIALLSQNPHPGSWKHHWNVYLEIKVDWNAGLTFTRDRRIWKTALAKLREMKKRSFPCQEPCDLIWWWSELISLIYFSSWHSNGHLFLGFNASSGFKTPCACFLNTTFPWPRNPLKVILPRPRHWETATN